MKPHAFLLLLALIPLAPVAAFAGPNGAIDMFRIDPVTGLPDFNSCHATTDLIPGGSGQILISVQARLAGLTAAGITGAEFYVNGLENMPPNWACEDTAMGIVHVGDICEPAIVGGGTVRRGNTAFQTASQERTASSSYTVWRSLLRPWSRTCLPT